MKRKITYRKGIIPLMLFAVTGVSFGQETVVFYNKGEFFVDKKSEVTTIGEFKNSESGDFTNDGNVYFLDNFKNDGIYDFSLKSLEGHTYFINNGSSSKNIVLEGVGGDDHSTKFMNLTVDTNGINLENEVSVHGKTYFKKGNVVVNERANGAITFMEGASVEQVGDQSHVVGAVEREGTDKLSLPVGDGKYHRPIILGGAQNKKDIYAAKYKYENPLTHRPHDVKNAILEVNDTEYWEVDNNSKTGFVVVELTWNENTTAKNILDKVGKGLHILRWDEDSKLWVDESGEVDMANKTIATVSEIYAKGIFTLGIVDATFTNEIKIYNAVSPNGDGQNDYFLVENINQFPNNSVQIVNRWGAKVFDATNYDPNGDGSENVFKGQSGGRGVIGSGKLPSGTYYYIVKYERKKGNGSEWLTKSGYLHLENN